MIGGAAVALTAILIAAGGAGMAQESSDGPALAQDLGEGKLRAFAIAWAEVRRVEDEVSSSLEEAETIEGRRAVERQARARMAEAVERVPGITLEEYNAIHERMRSDEALAVRIEQHMDEAEL
jgi:hypothetical protein